MKLPYGYTVLLVSLAVGLSACKRPSKQEDATSASNASGVATTTESGKPAKWTMPEAMMRHIRNLEQDVSDLNASSGKDHAALAAKIKEHTSQLISSCTMDGDAHDALHDWLMPFLQLNKAYAAAPDAKAQAAKFKEIQDSLAVFHERFE
jgi:hypothetical protein